ncbi:hypothetical protein U1Q18_041633, partial [Sarracenia purpurea var. burkii]
MRAALFVPPFYGLFIESGLSKAFPDGFIAERGSQNPRTRRFGTRSNGQSLRSRTCHSSTSDQETLDSPTKRR